MVLASPPPVSCIVVPINKPAPLPWIGLVLTIVFPIAGTAVFVKLKK